MDPITGASNAVDKAADLGPEVFLAVVVVVFCGGMMWLMMVNAAKHESVYIDALANNTRALDGLAPILASIYKDLGEHDHNTAGAVGEIHQLKPVVERIDARTAAMDSKMDKLLWKGEKRTPGGERAPWESQ